MYGDEIPKFASAILDGPTLELVVLTLLVELDTGSHTDVVGNVSCPDCIARALGSAPPARLNASAAIRRASNV
jgi:hypothetical protein